MRIMAISISLKAMVAGCILVIIFITLLLTQTMDTQSYRKVMNRNGNHILNQDHTEQNINKGEQGSLDILEFQQQRPYELQTRCTSQYGKPILGKDIVVVYNRVPKCGSRTMVSLANALAQRNGYKKPKPIITLSQPNEYRLVRSVILSTRSPGFIDGHVYFMDIKNDSKYKFISFVRDPLERMVSRYYFTRFGDDEFPDVKKLHAITKPEFVNETFDDCVLRKRRACSSDSDLSQQLRFFCGYHPRCRIPSRWSVEEAKRNIDKFLLVGVTEQYSDTLEVLEHLLPDFFKGLVAEYRKPKEGNMTFMTKSRNKVPPSPVVAEIMKEKLKYEYQVYNYAVKKFNRLRHDVFD